MRPDYYSYRTRLATLLESARVFPFPVVFIWKIIISEKIFHDEIIEISTFDENIGQVGDRVYKTTKVDIFVVLD